MDDSAASPESFRKKSLARRRERIMAEANTDIVAAEDASRKRREQLRRSTQQRDESTDAIVMRVAKTTSVQSAGGNVPPPSVAAPTVDVSRPRALTRRLTAPSTTTPQQPAHDTSQLTARAAAPKRVVRIAKAESQTAEKIGSVAVEQQPEVTQPQDQQRPHTRSVQQGSVAECDFPVAATTVPTPSFPMYG